MRPLGQAELGLDERDHWRLVGHRFVVLLRSVVERIGLKETAFALDVDVGTLAHALAGRKRHVPHADWVPVIIALAPDDEALEFLAALRGRDLVAAKPLDPAEEVLGYRAVVSELPADFRQIFENRMRAWRRNGGGR